MTVASRKRIGRPSKGRSSATSVEPVAPSESAGLQAFELGPDAGQLVVRYETPHRTAWLVLTTFTLVVFALLALPVGRRRVR